MNVRTLLITQENCQLKITTPLGDDALILDRLTGTEQACLPYCFTLEMHSRQDELDFSALIPEPVQICFEYGEEKRYFCGILGDIEQRHTTADQDITHYVAHLYPMFWLLKFTQDHRIFQNKTAIEIILSILNENNVTQVEDLTSVCGRTPREYCVQYGESHFHFVSRLMEEEGIFYFFKHTAAGETLVLADSTTPLPTALEENLPVNPAQTTEPAFNVIQALNPQQQVVPKTFQAADYNFKMASTNLLNRLSGDGDSGVVYRYPGRYATVGEGETVSKLGIEELEWRKKTVRGRSTTPLFCPLYKFSVTDHPRRDANRQYILYKITHDLFINATEKESYLYRNDYEAFPDDVDFRSPLVTPKPIIPSTQTAKVTGKPGEEIWVDEYGRIKVKFHWDQRGPDDDRSSCWIRCAALWAGSNWGSVWTPRVGMEVVVTFLEGNPDRPLITGCVYNSDNKPPYVEDEPTKSTLKSNSSTGGSGYNELRFDDKKGEEEVYLQAEKDLNTLVKDSRTLEIQKGDDTTQIMRGSRTVTLLAKSKKQGNDALTLTNGDRSVLIMLGNQLVTLTKGNRLLNLMMGNEVVSVNGSRIITVAQNEVRTVGQNFAINVGKDIEIVAEGNITIIAGKTLKLVGNPIMIG